MEGLILESAALSGALQTAEPDSSVQFLDVSRHDSATVYYAQFYVGPIPVNVTVDVGLLYGLDGRLFYRYSPLSALGLPPGGDASQLAAVGGKLVPSIGATLELFAGVGFDVPGFAVKAGISGNLMLANASGNLESGVGLSVRALADDRPTPAPLDVLGTGERFFPARQHEFFIDWFYGASLRIDDILNGTINAKVNGTINAKVKLKAFLFSKTYKKTLVSFDGPFAPIEKRLLEGGAQLPGILLPAPAGSEGSLGVFQMQIPLVKLKKLPVPASEAPGTQAFLEGTLLSPLNYDGVCTKEAPNK